MFQLYQHNILLELEDNQREQFYQQMDYKFLVGIEFQLQLLEHNTVQQDMNMLDDKVLLQHQQYLKLYCK